MERRLGMIDRIMETFRDPVFWDFLKFIGCVAVYFFSMYLIYTSILMNNDDNKLGKFFRHFVALTPFINTFFCVLLILSLLIGYIVDCIRRNPLDYNDPDKVKYLLNVIYWLDMKISNINYVIRYKYRKRTKIEDKWLLMNSNSLKK
jgi:hypothetical protein